MLNTYELSPPTEMRKHMSMRDHQGKESAYISNISKPIDRVCPCDKLVSNVSLEKVQGVTRLGATELGASEREICL